MRLAAQSSHCSRWPPSAAVRHAAIAPTMLHCDDSLALFEDFATRRAHAFSIGAGPMARAWRAAASSTAQRTAAMMAEGRDRTGITIAKGYGSGGGEATRQGGPRGCPPVLRAAASRRRNGGTFRAPAEPADRTHA